MTDPSLDQDASLPFNREDHLRIAKSGADLSQQEKFALLSHLHSHMEDRGELTEFTEKQRQSPVFFGTWSGLNPFRHLKPFFLSRRQERH